MPGEEFYTIAELQNMTPEQFAQAQANGLRRLVAAPGAPAEERPAAAGVPVASPFPAVVTQPADAGNVWGRKGSRDEFIVPSGQKCRMKPLQLEELLMEGVLDQVTRLDGLAQELVNLAQGLPPEKQQMPSRDDMATLLNLVNKVVRLAVAEPRVFEDDDPDAPEDAIRISDIDLMDRVAILNKALEKVKGLDNFRNAG
jgi:hypothetical protein